MKIQIKWSMACLLFISLVPPVNAANNEVWFALSAQACIGEDTDLAVNNGLTISDLSSDNMTCTQASIGNDMVYSIDWEGSDFDRDGTNDTLTFDLRVEGFAGSTYSYSAIAGESSMTALGESSPVTSDTTNNFWDVEDNDITGIGAGQSLRFSVENIKVSVSDYSATMNGFDFISLIETGGRIHTHIRGEGTGLDSSTFSNDSVYSFLSLQPFVITGAGDYYSHLLGSINQIQFSFSISNPELVTTLDDYDYSLYGMGPDFFDVYPESDASRQAYYPEFSWDTVPRWLAVRNSDSYTDQQIETIAAHYQLVMLEKANEAGLETVDEGIKETSRRLKEINPNISNIFYWNSVIFYSGYSNDEDYEENASAWSVLNDDGSIYLFKDKYYNYNSEVEEARDWWVELPTTIAADDNIDGVFVDKITKAAFDEIFVDGEPINGYVDMLNQLHEKMPDDKILIGNVLRGERNNGNRSVMALFDGSYLERWDFTGDIAFPEQTEADAIAVSIQMMREALAQGKLINLQTAPMTDEDVPDTYEEQIEFMETHVDYPLAIFLIVAEENAFFSYQLSVNALPSANTVWDSSYIEELNHKLGEPLGDPVKDGYIYTRSFEYVDVWLDLQNGEALLTWRDTPISAN